MPVPGDGPGRGRGLHRPPRPGRPPARHAAGPRRARSSGGPAGRGVTAMTTYPVHREADVVLRDGSTVHVRPARLADAAEIERLLKGLSDRSRWLRFFSGYPNLAKAVRWATEVDYERRYGLVATSGADGRVVGHAGFERQPDHPDRAEVALEIADAMQGKGLGTILLGQLAEAANQLGVQVLDAEVLAENHLMVKVFRDSGFPVKTHSLPGYLLVEFPTSLSPEALERFERREQVAATAAMRAFFEPRSVAVVGASRRRGTVSGELFHNLLAADFNGPVYPVNPKASVVQSVVAYKSVLDVPGPVDLAVLALPAPYVVQAAQECAAKGVRAIVVISAGFAETGPEGAQRQRELLAVCRAAGMRLIGPNCLGILNTDPVVRLDATFGPIVPLPGRVGFLSQSGALGLAIIDYANALVLGVKSGRSAAGARATSSHTGALLAASDVTVDALFDQAGVIRTDSLAELFDVASLLANQPIPAGRRVGIVTNAGGPGIMCADACEAGGLEGVQLSPPLQASLAE